MFPVAVREEAVNDFIQHTVPIWQGQSELAKEVREKLQKSLVICLTGFLHSTANSFVECPDKPRSRDVPQLK